MSEEERFDEIIRSRFSGEEFSFSEENWEKAERNLDSVRRRKKIASFSLVFIGGLIVGIILMIPFIKPVKPIDGGSITQITGSGKEVVPVPNNESVASVENDETKVVDPASVRNREDVGVSAGIRNDSKQEDKQEKLTQKEHASVSNQLKKGTTPALTLVKGKDEKNGLSDSSELSHHDPSVLISMDLREKISNEIVNETVNETANETVNETANETVKERKIINLQRTIDSLSELIASRNALDSLRSRKDSSESKLSVSAAVSKNPAGVSAKDTLSASKSVLRANHLFLEAGTFYNSGWHYGAIREAQGFNPVIGIGLTHLFDQKWSLSASVHYKSIGYLTVSSKTYFSSTPDFGSDIVELIIDTKILHYAVVPVFVNYHFNADNWIGIGGSLSYLLTATGEISTNTSVDFKNPVQTEKTAIGYTQGFNLWDASLAISYKRRIVKRLLISAEAHYGLMDIKDNVFFSQQNFERSSGIELLISYDLFKP